MPTRFPLTNARVAALAIPRQGRTTVYDTRMPGLAVRLHATGRRSFYATKRGPSGMEWVHLGSCESLDVEAARRMAAQAIATILAGKSPNAEKRAQRAEARGGRVPLDVVLERHVSKLTTRERSPLHVAEISRIAKAAQAAGLRDLADPKAAALAERWLAGLTVSELTRARYRRHLVALGRTALRWFPPDLLPRDPFAGLSGDGAPLPMPPVFTPAEAALLVSDEALARDGGLLWAFLLYTGTRFREATWALWDRLSLDQATFAVIPPTVAERAAGAAVKRNKARTVPLQPELVALLRPLRPHDGTGFVFDAIWRRQRHTSIVHAFRAHLDSLSIPLERRRIHSLRHTHACLAIAAGEDSLRLRLAMGHAGEVMAAHYAQQAMRWRNALHHWSGIWNLRTFLSSECKASAHAQAPSSTLGPPQLARNVATTKSHYCTKPNQKWTEKSEQFAI